MELKKEIQKGTVIAIYEKRGFGFIRNDETGESIFFHKTSLLNFPIEQMVVGDTVGYREINSMDEKIIAGHVRRVATIYEEEGDR